MDKTPVSALQDVLNELNSIEPGSGAIHDHNTHRIGIQQAINMYNKPGREEVITRTYHDAVEYLIRIRVQRLKSKGIL